METTKKIYRLNDREIDAIAEAFEKAYELGSALKESFDQDISGKRHYGYYAEQVFGVEVELDDDLVAEFTATIYSYHDDDDGDYWTAPSYEDSVTGVEYLEGQIEWDTDTEFEFDPEQLKELEKYIFSKL